MNRTLGVILSLILILTACGKKKSKTILILGNSITIHAPSPALDWTHNWGMAATAPDSDYVHLLIDSIHIYDPTAIIRIKEIGDFERGFVLYNSHQLDSLKEPYLLIMRVRENVNDQDAPKKDFISSYDRLIKYLSPQKTVLTDAFWNNT